MDYITLLDVYTRISQACISHRAFIYSCSSHKKKHITNTFNPFVSVIIPCHNEEKTLAYCIQSVLKNSYKNKEIIIVNDGSTDNTAMIAHRLSLQFPSIRVYSKEQGGKAQALNCGIQNAKGEIIVSIDADSVLKKNAIETLIPHFSNPNIGAVSGNVKVANKHNFWGLHQAGEYLSGLNLQRRAFALLNAIQVIPGAIGAFRKHALFAAGGYSADTKVEDMDMTVAIQKKGYKALYEPRAIAYTEAPENMKDFVIQRHRWIYGSFRVITKYKQLLFCKNGGTIGNIGLTGCLVFQITDLLISFLFVLTLILTFMTGNTVTIINIIYTIIMIQSIIMLYALILDKDTMAIAASSVLIGVWYYNVLSVITVWALFSYFIKEEEKHIHLERLGRNVLKLSYT